MKAEKKKSYDSFKSGKQSLVVETQREEIKLYEKLNYRLDAIVKCISAITKSLKDENFKKM